MTLQASYRRITNMAKEPKPQQSAVTQRNAAKAKPVKKGKK
jgi:hypothetical protein